MFSIIEDPLLIISRAPGRVLQWKEENVGGFGTEYLGSGTYSMSAVSQPNIYLKASLLCILGL